jgi:cytochrome c-type biogenesis protein CcmH/NrfG
MNLGVSYANLNQYEEAAKAYIKALHLSPDARYIIIIYCINNNIL